MTNIVVNNAVTADDLRASNTPNYRLINVNKTVSEMLTFAYTRIAAKNSAGDDEVTFNFTRNMYDKWLKDIKPETRVKVHERFVNFLDEKGFNIDESIDIDGSDIIEDYVTVSWNDDSDYEF